MCHCSANRTSRSCERFSPVEPVLKDHPIHHANVVSQARWSLLTGSITLKCRTFYQEYLSFKTSGLSWQWSLKTGVTVLVHLHVQPLFALCNLYDGIVLYLHVHEWRKQTYVLSNSMQQPTIWHVAVKSGHSLCERHTSWKYSTIAHYCYWYFASLNK